MPNAEGTGKRLVRRPHPPPTTAPLPDDFDAITETRESTTIYDDATSSALGIEPRHRKRARANAGVLVGQGSREGAE